MADVYSSAVLHFFMWSSLLFRATNPNCDQSWIIENELKNMNIQYKKISTYKKPPNCFYVLKRETTRTTHKQVCEDAGGTLAVLNQTQVARTLPIRFNEYKSFANRSYFTGLILERPGNNGDWTWFWESSGSTPNLKIEINKKNQLVFESSEYGSLNLSLGASNIIKNINNPKDYVVTLNYKGSGPHFDSVDLIKADQHHWAICENAKRLLATTRNHTIATKRNHTIATKRNHTIATKRNSTIATQISDELTKANPTGTPKSTSRNRLVGDTIEESGTSMIIIGPIFVVLLLGLLLLIILLLVKITKLRKEIDAIPPDAVSQSKSVSAMDTSELICPLSKSNYHPPSESESADGPVKVFNAPDLAPDPQTEGTFRYNSAEGGSMISNQSPWVPGLPQITNNPNLSDPPQTIDPIQVMDPPQQFHTM